MRNGRNDRIYIVDERSKAPLPSADDIIQIVAKEKVPAFRSKNRRPSPVRDRIFRAMYASPFFTSREIAILSGAKIKLIKKLIWIHRKAGEIEITATKGHRHGGRKHIYRLTSPDEFYLKWLRPARDDRRP